MIPKTFSAPGEGYVPSIEDRVRDAVWLLMIADNLHSKYYSYDEGDADKGVRISAGFAHTRNKKFVVPQLLVQSTVEESQLEYEVQQDAIKRVTIAVTHFEPPLKGTIEVDTDAPPFTPESLLARTDEILMRGTLYFEDQTSNRGVIIDPYASPLLPGGTYDPDDLRPLNKLLPTVRRRTPFAIGKTLDPASQDFDIQGDIAVLYMTLATYEIDLPDREEQH